ncbi:MAG: hypothetical protein J3Q66DRAFT_398736 [Benniella sp.]|nr:MAG: hypothetical protein J3Q66DRAFT_398736 [Benniella sp.]
MSTPGCLPQDRTGTSDLSVHAPVPQADTHSSPAPTSSWLDPNNAEGSAQTFDNKPQAACASGPDVTLSFVPQQHNQTFPFINLSPQSLSPAPTQQQLAQLRFQLVQSQQREEQLQLQLIHRDQWLQQFLQQQPQQPLYLQQQQHRPEQYFTSQNGPPSQEPLPMNNGSLTPIQPWGSEIPLYPSTSVSSTSYLAPSSLHAHLPSIIQTKPNLGQSGQPHVPSASLRLAPVVMDCDVMEKDRPDRVETSSKPGRKRLQRRLTDEESQDIISRREGNAPESFQTIANAIGCSKSTAWRKRKKHLLQTKLSEREDS